MRKLKWGNCRGSLIQLNTITPMEIRSSQEDKGQPKRTVIRRCANSYSTTCPAVLESNHALTWGCPCRLGQPCNLFLIPVFAVMILPDPCKAHTVWHWPWAVCQPLSESRRNLNRSASRPISTRISLGLITKSGPGRNTKRSGTSSLTAMTKTPNFSRTFRS